MKNGFIFLILVFLANGCGEIKNPFVTSSKSKKAIDKVEDVELARSILWPKSYKFDVERDPFKPLIGNRDWEKQEKTIVVKDEIKVIGVVELGERAVAFLETPFKTGTFQVGDEIGKYKIERIASNRVVLKKGKEEVILKVGGEDE